MCLLFFWCTQANFVQYVEWTFVEDWFCAVWYVEIAFEWVSCVRTLKRAETCRKSTEYIRFNVPCAHSQSPSQIQCQSHSHFLFAFAIHKHTQTNTNVDISSYYPEERHTPSFILLSNRGAQQNGFLIKIEEASLWCKREYFEARNSSRADSSLTKPMDPFRLRFMLIHKHNRSICIWQSTKNSLHYIICECLILNCVLIILISWLEIPSRNHPFCISISRFGPTESISTNSRSSAPWRRKSSTLL